MSKKSKDKDAQVEDLKRRLIAVRGGATQRAFADSLGVSQPTIATWEKGMERPARERFLDLAKLASTKVERLWFLKEAGVDLALVKSDIREDAVDRLESLDEVGPEGRDSLAAVPVVEISELQNPMEPASLAKGDFEKVHIAARHLANAEDVVAFSVPRDKQFFPFWLNPNDLILIDRGKRLLREFFIEEHHRCLHLAAVLIPHLDLFLHNTTGGGFDITGTEQGRLRAEERGRKVAAQPATPILMIGHFEEEIAGAQTPRIPNETDLCRLIFLHGRGGRMPLTEWAQGIRPRDLGPSVKLLHDAKIVGAVSGWLSSPRAIGLKEHIAENERRSRLEMASILRRGRGEPS